MNDCLKHVFMETGKVSLFSILLLTGFLFHGYGNPTGNTGNNNACIVLDADLVNPGCQGDSTIAYPGENKNIGFAVYIGNYRDFASAEITFSWDETFAVCNRNSRDIL